MAFVRGHLADSKVQLSSSNQTDNSRKLVDETVVSMSDHDDNHENATTSGSSSTATNTNSQGFTQFPKIKLSSVDDVSMDTLIDTLKGHSVFVTEDKSEFRNRVFYDIPYTEEGSYLNLLDEMEDKFTKEISKWTFICISGTYESGKSTLLKLLESVYQTETNPLFSPKSVSITTLNFAKPLKKSVAASFGLDFKKLQNLDEDSRSWLSDLRSPDALFWTGAILKSKYLNVEKDPTKLSERIKGIPQYSNYYKPISSTLFPVTPRKMVEYVANDMYKNMICQDFWIFSTLKKLYDYTLVNETKNNNKKRYIGIIGDTRFLNEVLRLFECGASVIYLHITRVHKPDHKATAKDIVLDLVHQLIQKTVQTKEKISDTAMEEEIELFYNTKAISTENRPSTIAWKPYFTYTKLLKRYHSLYRKTTVIDVKENGEDDITVNAIQNPNFISVNNVMNYDGNIQLMQNNAMGYINKMLEEKYQ